MLSRAVIVVIVFALLTVILTWPVMERLSSGLPTLRQLPGWVPGDSDGWLFLWNMWWVWKSLKSPEHSVFETDMIFWPHHVSLRFHSLSLVNCCIGVLIHHFQPNWLTVYNILFLASYILSGLFCWLLLFWLTKSPGAGFIGSFIFTFCPYHFLHSLEHLNLTSIQWLPLSLLLFLHFRSTRKPWSIIALSLSIALTYFVSFYYVLMCAFLFFLLLLCDLVKLPLATEVESRTTGKNWHYSGIAFAATALVIGLCTFTTLSPGEMENYRQMSSIEQMIYSADLTSYLVPNPLHPLWGEYSTLILESLPGNIVEKTITPGLVSLSLLMLLLVTRRTGKAAKTWLLIGLVFVILSLGPVLTFDGSPLTLFGHRILLPFNLVQFIPVLSQFRAPARFSIMVVLSISIVLALSLRGEAAGLQLPASGSKIRQSGKKMSGRVGYALILGLLIFECWSVPLPILDGSVPEIYQAIRKDNRQFTVMEIPLDPRIRIYQWYQTVHQKPLLAGYLARFPRQVMQQFNDDPILSALANRNGFDIGESVDKTAFLEVLGRYNVGYIIVHKDFFTVTGRVSILSFLSDVKNMIVQETPHLIVLKTKSPSESG
jgi:hypothetical protein